MCTYSYWICARTLDYPELIIRGHASRLPTLPPRDNRPFRIFEIHLQPSIFDAFVLTRSDSVQSFDSMPLLFHTIRVPPILKHRSRIIKSKRKRGGCLLDSKKSARSWTFSSAAARKAVNHLTTWHDTNISGTRMWQKSIWFLDNVSELLITLFIVKSSACVYENDFWQIREVEIQNRIINWKSNRALIL